MFDKFQIVQIQGKSYTVDELRLLCKERIDDSVVLYWEKEIYLFILDLFSSSQNIVVSTSGSTGYPKEIKLQKKYLIASAKATLTFFNLKKNDSIWLCMPVKYIAGKMMIVRSIVGGLDLYYTKPSSLPLLGKEINVDFTAMVANQVFEILENKDGAEQLSKINKLLIGGSYLPNDVEERILNTPSVNAWHSYGMTETITHIALRKLSPENESRVFSVLPEISISVNQDEHLVIDAPSIGVFDLVTNDLARVNIDGTFVIIGRADNVIISGGVKLLPEIIERKISDFITSNFFIGGVPDKKLGERLTLFIEGYSANKRFPKHFKEVFNKKLKKFEVPKEIIYLPTFSRTDLGKIKRKENISKFLGNNNLSDQSS